MNVRSEPSTTPSNVTLVIEVTLNDLVDRWRGVFDSQTKEKRSPFVKFSETGINVLNLVGGIWFSFLSQQIESSLSQEMVKYSVQIT